MNMASGLKGMVVGLVLIFSADYCSAYNFLTLNINSYAVYPRDINNKGEIVGYYRDSNKKCHGFYYYNGS